MFWQGALEPAQVDTVVLDFDNTLYDWVGQWYGSFSALLAEVVRISGVAPDQIKREARQIHQRHYTSEYAFLLEELPSLGGEKDLLTKYASAIQSAREARRRNLKLYDGVLDTIHALKRSGRKIVVFTESQTFYTIMRFKKLGLEGEVDFLFTSEDHEIDQSVVAQIRSHPPEFYKLSDTVHRAVCRGRLKPDPETLLEIVSEVGSASDRVAYVGDSLYKDVMMANDAGILSVWARYGEARETQGYDLLREVSHWTDADVDADRKLKLRDVEPDITLNAGLDDLLPAIGVSQ